MTRLRFRNLLLLVAAFALLHPASHAQQLDCDVTVDLQQVPSSNRDRLVNLERDIEDYMNRHPWGQDELETKIRCSVNILVRSVVAEDKYSAQVFVGSQRPIWGTRGRSTGVVRVLDEEWEFTYLPTTPLVHNEMEFRDLASFLDYYAYMIIALDYDSYVKYGGTDFYQKAGNIANIAKSRGAAGWQVKQNTYSRTRWVEEMMNPSYIQTRNMIYRYYFTGLDSLVIDPLTAQKNILDALSVAELARRWDRQDLVFFRVFFDSNHQEIAEVFRTYPDKAVYNRLVTLDPTHRRAYEEAYSKFR
jgi:hypothetical protein